VIKLLELTKNILNQYLTNQLQEEKRVDIIHKNELIDTRHELKKNNEEKSYERKKYKIKKNRFVVEAVAYKKDIQIEAEKTQVLEQDNATGLILDRKK